MTAAIHDRGAELLALEGRIADWAHALTHDPAEARALIEETLILAQDTAQGPTGTQSLQSWTLRLLRERFYSVERGRSYRRAKSAAVTELDETRKRAVLARALADADVH